MNALCARPGCLVVFRQHRPGHRYHSRRCNDIVRFARVLDRYRTDPSFVARRREIVRAAQGRLRARLLAEGRCVRCARPREPWERTMCAGCSTAKYEHRIEIGER